MKNLTFVHNRHPEYKTTNKIKSMAESVEAFEFSLQETLKDLWKNGKLIDLKPKQGAAILVGVKEKIVPVFWLSVRFEA